MTFMRTFSVSTQYTPASTTGAEGKQVLIAAQRLTSGKLILPQNGATQPNLYEPIVLPAFATGTNAISYLTNLGLNTQIGINFTLDLPAPTTVTFSNSTTILTWATPPYGFNQLTNFALSGILNQGLVNGSVMSATFVSGVATMVVQGSPAFVTSGDSGATMTLNGLNNVIYPDPEVSDPICLLAWDFYQSRLSAATPSTGYPSAILSIVSDRDTTITANPTPIDLPIPNTVTVNPDSSVTLSFDYTALDVVPVDNATGQVYISNLTNFGYLPTSAYGNSILSQPDGNATSTYGGFAIYPSDDGGTVEITVTNVTGTFNNTDTLSIVLDNTINVFNFLDGVNLYGAVQQWPINDLTDITTTYADFYDGVAALNEPDQVLNNHFFTYAVAGNITILPSQVTTLPSPNSPQDILVTYPYIAQFGDIPYDNSTGTVGAGRVAAATLYMLANGDIPFPSLGGSTINHLPVSSLASTISYQNSNGGTGDLAVGQGWMPLAPINSGVVQILQSNTTLITVPVTNTLDVEFRYTHVTDMIRWTKLQVTTLFNNIKNLPNNAGSAFISPQFLRQFKVGIQSILVTGQNLGGFENVSQYIGLVTVIQDPENPNQVDAYIPEQIVPQLNGGTALINVFSSLYNFQGAQ